MNRNEVDFAHEMDALQREARALRVYYHLLDTGITPDTFGAFFRAAEILGHSDEQAYRDQLRHKGKGKETIGKREYATLHRGVK